MRKTRIMTSFSGLALCAGLAALLSGCRTDGPDDGVSRDMTVFEVTAEFPTQRGATMTITHNGPSDCRFAGCVFAGGESMEAAIAARIEELKSQAESASFEDITFSGSGYTDVVTGLQANKEYSYAVFGVNGDFTTYGTPGSCTFTTQTGAGLFTIHTVAAGENTATIQVLPRSGYSDRPYFVFWTSDLDTPAEDLISRKVESLENPGQYVKTAQDPTTGDTYVIPGDDILPFGENETLERGKKYRAIVTGMYSDGRIYGLPSEVLFKTSRGDMPFEVNDNWNISYAGKGLYTDNISGSITACDNIRVVVEESSNDRYFISAVKGSDLPAFLNPDSSTPEEKQKQLKKIIDQETEIMRTRVNNQYFGQTLSWYDFTYNTSVQNPFEEMSSDEPWFAIVIGIDADIADGYEGAELDKILSGKYNISEPLLSEKPQTSPEYERWVGKWTVSGSYLDVNSTPTDISFDIDIIGDFPGIGYIVRGFGAVEGIMDESITVPDIGVLFDNETGKLNWTGSYLSQMTLDEASGIYASIYFAALSGDEVIVGDNFVMAESELSADGNSSEIAAVPFELSDGSEFTATSIGYIADVMYMGYMLVSVNPELPIGMVRKTDSSAPEDSPAGIQGADAFSGQQAANSWASSDKYRVRMPCTKVKLYRR